MSSFKTEIGLLLFKQRTEMVILVSPKLVLSFVRDLCNSMSMRHTLITLVQPVFYRLNN